jgi:hypothetical protein
VPQSTIIARVKQVVGVRIRLNKKPNKTPLHTYSSLNFDMPFIKADTAQKRSRSEAQLNASDVCVGGKHRRMTKSKLKQPDNVKPTKPYMPPSRIAQIRRRHQITVLKQKTRLISPKKKLTSKPLPQIGRQDKSTQLRQDIDQVGQENTALSQHG